MWVTMNGSKHVGYILWIKVCGSNIAKMRYIAAWSNVSGSARGTYVVGCLGTKLNEFFSVSTLITQSVSNRRNKKKAIIFQSRLAVMT